MAANRQQRRQQLRKGKRQGENYADVLARKKMIADYVLQEVHSESVKLEADIMNQRLMWECVVALNDAFGFGKERSIKFMQALQNVLEQVQQMRDDVDEQYAFEKLRQRAAAITGIDIKYIHEDEMIKAREYALADGFDFPRDDI